MDKKIVLIFLFISFTWIASSQNTIIRGVVTDSITGETLPYVSLILEGTTIGTTTDLSGKFNLSTTSRERTLLVSYLGYAEKKLTINPGRTNTLNIELAPSTINLSEVLIKPGKERYSRRDNPAVTFIRNAIDARDKNDPRNHDYFTYNQYEKVVFAMNEYERKPRTDGRVGRFDFFADFVDTLEAGTTILPVSEKEKQETIYYRKSPRLEKRLVLAQKSAGVDEIFSRDGIAQILNEVFKEVDIFQNDISLFLQRFVSPMSTLGPTFYKYYLLDTVVVNNQPCIDLGFAPFNSESFGFTGHLFITLDSTYFVQRTILNVPKNINLNFVSRMVIDQTYDRTEDGTRIILKDDIEVNFKINEKSKGMYARRLNVYSNHSFNPPENMPIFRESAPIITVEDAFRKPETYWEEVRPPEGRRKNPNSVEKLMMRLREVPLFYVTEKVVSLFVNGYIATNTNPLKSKFEFGPVNTFISGNAIEGARFRLGGTTTTNFSKRLFLDGLVAYGTKDEKLKYNLIAEYSFHDKTDYRKEFPVHSIRAQYFYDINQIGQQYMYTNKDNIFLAWKRQKDDRATYLRFGELTYYNESYNGLGFGASVRNKREYSTKYALFDRIEADGSIKPVKSYTMSELEFKVRYAPNEKFYQTRNYRYPITLVAPIFTLNHITAEKGFLGADYSYNRTDFSVQYRFWVPMSLGYIDIIGKAGKVWSKVPYPMLILPNANLSYTVQPESYNLMNAIEFINDEYASWDITYYMNGTIFNRMPLIKKLKLREVVTFRGLYGNLTDKNNSFKGRQGLYLFPEGSYPMGKDPYMEIGAGIENIFSFLRLDYVWRLTYRDNPNIQKNGVRFVMRLSF
ncbi:MAG: DUF5686 and carboxypeptidase regulatory-like domain-containing protein [Tannerellaceae bacterium]|jgi:hypothetical protein|nr:DUF5686 and carboxypeptidase regulatory-like domain-containing protein [Tannerellaceae bacterium]